MTNAKKIFSIALAGCLAAMGISLRPVHAVQPVRALQKEKVVRAPDASATFTVDKGKFRIVLDGQVYGSEEFELSPAGDNWIARSTTTAHLPGGGDIKATGQLRMAADGTPIRYDWSAQSVKQASGAVDFASGTAKSSINLAGASPYMQDFTFASPRIVVLDNNLYNQYDVLARLYDWKAGGKQSVSVLIPQDMTPGSIFAESLGPQQVAGVTYDAMRISSPDLEIMLYLDGGRRLMRLEVPASKVSITRE